MKRTASAEAGWTYLVATHMGTAFLIAMFVLLSGQCSVASGQQTLGTPAVHESLSTDHCPLTTSLDFASMGVGGDGRLAWVAFLLAVVGFGTKAGLMPMHVWLPKAHPGAEPRVGRHVRRDDQDGASMAYCAC